MIDQKLLDEALQRIARDAGKPGDGELLYIMMQKIVTGVSFPVAADGDISGALRENLGKRKLASEIMAVMAEVMAEPVGDRASDEQRAKLARGERPIIFQFPRPTGRGSRQRGAGRRVRPTEPSEPAAE
jgi:hypothetical protein